MFKKNNLLKFVPAVIMAVLVMSCSDDDDKGGPVTPLSAEISYSTDDNLSISFQGVSPSSTEWHWDFGDGTESTEQNPLHEYSDGGYYEIVFTSKKTGSEATDNVRVGLNITDYVLLTGGPTALEGKTWRISPAHSSEDAIYVADGFVEAPMFKPLPGGVLDFYLGMPEVYDNTFTFHYDGGYEVHSPIGTAFSGIGYQGEVPGVDNIANLGSDKAVEIGLCTGYYTPESDLKFVYVESEDYTVETAEYGSVTYTDVTTVDFDKNGYFVVWEYNSKGMIVEQGEDTMLVHVHAAPAGYQGRPFMVLAVTLEVVK